MRIATCLGAVHILYNAKMSVFLAPSPLHITLYNSSGDPPLLKLHNTLLPPPLPSNTVEGLWFDVIKVKIKQLNQQNTVLEHTIRTRA